jgi:GT2 family glycosyltransferase
LSEETHFSERAGWTRSKQVSVVVPTRNRQQFVRELVESILQGSSVPDEIVVIDQSDEPDLDLPSRFAVDHCKIVHRPVSTRGASRARNEGIRVARSDILVFVDDDDLPAATWLERLVSTLVEEEEGRTVVTGQVRMRQTEEEGGFAPSLRTEELRITHAGRAAANVLWTSNMAMLRSAVDEVGYFDERLGPGTSRFPGGGEDNDYCFRLLEAGFRIVYEPGAVVFHRAWRPERDYVGLRWRYGRGQGGFYAKHVSLRDRYILQELTRHVASLCGAAVRQVRREPRRAAGSVAYAAGIVTAAAEWLVTKRLLRR